jgi:peptidyl-prolyl cis-trans isomerase D
MLNAMRRGANSWIIRGLLILIVVSFVIVGVESGRFGGPTTVASVGDVRVTPEEYGRAFQLELNSRSQASGERYTTEEAVAAGLDKQVMERLVFGAALDKAAQELGLHISDARLAEQIHEFQSFRGVDGKFDMQVYRQALAQQGMSEHDFERETRHLILRADLMGALRSGIRVPEAIVQAMYGHASEVRWARYIRVPSAGMTVPQPTDADLKAYYDSHQQVYSLPEFRGFSFIVLNNAQMASKVDVTEEMIAQEYAARKDTLSEPEKRDLKQIIIADEAAAKAAKEKIDGGADFLAVAREAGISQAEAVQPGADKGKLAYLGEEAADQAFSLEEGAVGAPVKSKLGWVIFKVDAITPGKSVSLDEARPQLTKDLSERLSAQKLEELAAEARTKIAEGATIQAVAEALALPLRTVEAMNNKGEDANGVSVADIPAPQGFKDSLFSKVEGEFIDLEDDGENGFFILQLDTIRPASVQPFAEIKELVRVDWTQDARNQAARSMAEKIAEKVRGGASMEAAAQEAGSSVGVTPPVPRGNAARLASEFSRELIEAIYAAPKDGVVHGASSKSDGYFVAQVAEISPMPVDETTADYRQLRDSLYVAQQNDMYAQFQTYLYNTYSVTRNPGVVDTLIGQQQP